MNHRAALVLHWSFFCHLAQRLPGLAGVLRCSELKALLANGTGTASHEAYAKRYLFGDGSYQGLLCDYLAYGWSLDIIEETRFKASMGEFYLDYDRFDFQFASNISIDLVENLLARDSEVVGWGPPQLGSKQVQALLLASNTEAVDMHPQQLIVSNKCDLEKIDRQTIVENFSSEYLLAKAFYSSNATMPDGSGYRVFRKANWNKFVELALSNDSWFSVRDGLIISELIETRDPYLECNNAVVHKVHVASGLTNTDERAWRLVCKKLSAQLHLDRVGNSIKPISELFEFRAWSYAYLDDYREELEVVSDTFFNTPCLFSADFMIKPDGQLLFLEINKIAGTFLDHPENGTHIPLADYMRLTTSGKLENRLTRKNIIDYRQKLSQVLGASKDLNWLGVAQ